MDEKLRNLQRRAAAGDREARAALEAALQRLGGSGAEFRQPRVVPPLVEDYSDPVLQDAHRKGLWPGCGSPGYRRFERTRSHRRHRGRVRRALRSLRPEDWDDA